MISTSHDSVGLWASRWARLARAASIAPEEKLLLALSGGADSVFLLHLLAAAEPRPLVRAVHVDHGLRGEESRADARFCANLCRALGVPFALREIELDPEGPSLEARARQARYAALLEEARGSGHATILTGHHSDDALETLLLRWIRGSGLRGPRVQRTVGSARPGFAGPEGGAGEAIRVVRPLLPLRREEVRRLLADRGLRWREDGSNADPRFTRNRLRRRFLPVLERLCGEGGIENLRAFGQAVEALEERLAGATAHLSWSPAPYAQASRGPAEQALGGVLARSALMEVAGPLRRRALWRLLVEGTGRPPGRMLLRRVLDDLALGRCARHALPGDWSLLLRSDEIHLLPPRRPTAGPPATQPCLPFPLPASGRRGEGSPFAPRPGHRLPVPGIVTLPDGRRISAELVKRSPAEPPPHAALEVELDATALPSELCVRWPQSGDRFHALGAPGSKPLRRFLADRGVPREERASVPLVFARDEILWVAGVEPGERHRIRPRTHERLRLSLHPAHPVIGCAGASR